MARRLQRGFAATLVLMTSTIRLGGQEAHRVTGKVVLGVRKGVRPIAGAWVLLHRVGSDRAGPLDSMRTPTNGTYAFRYTPSGDSSAVYFASTMHDGVAYFTAPFRAASTTGDDATIIVYDTSAGPATVKVAGHHIIIGAPQAGGAKPVGEVFDLENDTTVTFVAGAGRPVWTTQIPASATNFQLNASGDIAPGATQRNGTTVSLYAPLSPGVRQFAFTYDLPPAAFPLKLPTDSGGGVLEVLVQAASASVAGGGLSERSAVAAEGRTFHRFLTQSVRPHTVVAIEIPTDAGSSLQSALPIVALVVLATMGVAFGFAWRRRAPAAAARAVPTPSERLLRELAALDDEMERAPRLDEAQRAVYAERRASLKSQLADVLAAEKRPA